MSTKDDVDEERDRNQSLSTNDIDVRLTKSMSQRERQLLHPLELNDKLAYETIKSVRLDFLTEEAVPPIPRCQALPSHAFSKLFLFTHEKCVQLDVRHNIVDRPHHKCTCAKRERQVNKALRALRHKSA